jgi:hypothetical protein
MYKIEDRHIKGIQTMMVKLIEKYKTSNSPSTRHALREHINFLGKMMGKDYYTKKQRIKLNNIRKKILQKKTAGKISISSKGIGSIIKNGDDDWNNYLLDNY